MRARTELNYVTLANEDRRVMNQVKFIQYFNISIIRFFSLFQFILDIVIKEVTKDSENNR